MLYDHPPGPAPASAEASWRAVRDRASSPARPRLRRCRAGRLDPPGPDRRRGQRASWRTAASPVVAGLPTALACARALRRGARRPVAAAGDRRGGLGRGARRAANGASAGATAGWTRPRRRRLLARRGHPGPATGRAGSPTRTTASRRRRELGWPVALKLVGRGLRHKSDAGALRARTRTTRRRCAAPATLAHLPMADGAASSSSGWPRPGVELLISARADAVVPALVVGARRASGPRPSTTSAIVPAAGGRRPGRGGDPLAARRAPLLDRRARPRAARPRRGRRRSPRGLGAALLERGLRCSSSTR